MKRIDNIDISYQRSYSLDNKQKKESQSNTTIDKIDIKSNTKNCETQIMLYKKPQWEFLIKESNTTKIENSLIEQGFKIDQVHFLNTIKNEECQEINKNTGSILDKENSVLIAEDSVKQIISMLSVAFESNIFKEDHDKVVLVLGKTGAGKSTLVNYLAKAPLLAVEIDDEISILCKGKELVDIGHTSQSNTTLPQKWVDSDGVVFWDCPGFNDNRSTAYDIANSTYITNIIVRAKSIKLMLLIPYSDTKGKANELINFVQHLDSLFYNKATDYADAFLLVVTKTPKNASISNIQQRLFNMSQSIKGSQKDLFEKLVKNINIFNEPDINQDLCEGFNENRDTILSNLSKITHLSEGVKINTTPSNTSIAQVINWYVDITNDITLKLKNISKDSVLELKKDIQTSTSNSLNQLLNHIDNFSGLKSEDITKFDSKKFKNYVENINDALKILSHSSEKEMKEKNIQLAFNMLDNKLFNCEEIFSKLELVNFLELFVPGKIILSYRSELLNIFEHYLIDLKFEGKLALHGSSNFDNLLKENKRQHLEADGIYANLMDKVENNKITVASGVIGGLTTGLATGFTVGTTIGVSLGISGAAVGAILGIPGIIIGGAIGYGIQKFINWYNN